MRGSGKENQELSLLGRIISLEALILLMGVVSLIYGLVTAGILHIIIGALILVAEILLARKCRQMRPK